MLHAFSQLEKKLFLRNSCENAYQLNGIAEHAQKAESSENLAENQLLKSGLKEFEGKGQHWNDLNLLEKRQN